MQRSLGNDLLVKLKIRLCDVTVITLRAQQSLLRRLAPKPAIADSVMHHPPGKTSSPTVYLGCDTLLPCKVLLHWGIKGRLPPLYGNGDADVNEVMSLLVQCWIFGGKARLRGVPGRRHASSAARVLEIEEPTPNLLATAFAESPPGSNLCVFDGGRVGVAAQPQ